LDKKKLSNLVDSTERIIIIIIIIKVLFL